MSPGPMDRSILPSVHYLGPCDAKLLPLGLSSQLRCGPNNFGLLFLAICLQYVLYVPIEVVFQEWVILWGASRGSSLDVFSIGRTEYLIKRNSLPHKKLNEDQIWFTHVTRIRRSWWWTQFTDRWVTLTCSLNLGFHKAVQYAVLWLCSSIVFRMFSRESNLCLNLCLTTSSPIFPFNSRWRWFMPCVMAIMLVMPDPLPATLEFRCSLVTYVC